MNSFLYLDHAAATPLDPRVATAMRPFEAEQYGNPSSLHRAGQMAQMAVDKARAVTAAAFGVSAGEVVFTSGGTESNNMALKGVLAAAKLKNPHLIVSAIEHESVLEVASFLERQCGVRVTRLPVDASGEIRMDALEQSLTPETVLVSVMAANNEVGTLQPLGEIANVLRAYKASQGRGLDAPPFFHTDACQAVGVMEWNLKEQGIDLLTFNGSKIYGPKGIGALIVRRGIALTPLLHGGGQEGRRRAGTQHVAGVVGLAEAVRWAEAERADSSARLSSLRDQLWSELKAKVPDVTLNGHATDRLPNNLNLTVRACPGEILLMQLDAEGIFASAGSACTAGSAEPSHVLLAMGVSKQEAYNTVRFSLGKTQTKQDMNRVVEIFERVVREIRVTQGTY